jgi:hypothetical protein
VARGAIANTVVVDLRVMNEYVGFLDRADARELSGRIAKYTKMTLNFT